jgi:hypothetical protein
MAGTLTISTLSDGTNSTSATNCIKGSAKVMVLYNMVTQTILSSYNVSSVTYNTTGQFTINFSITFANTNYLVTGASAPVASVGTGRGGAGDKTTSSVVIYNGFISGGGYLGSNNDFVSITILSV